MLTVRTLLEQSPIHGLGVFAAEAIPAGTTVWEFNPVVDRVIPIIELNNVPGHVRDYLEHFCEYFPERGELVLSGDSDRYTNHSDNPNTAVEGDSDSQPNSRMVAVRDIAEGEEITCDYGVIRSLKWLDQMAELA